MEIICRHGCEAIFKSTATRYRHETNHCPVLKEQRIAKIEADRKKNEEFEKMKNEIIILQNKNTKLKLKIEKLTSENKTITMKFVENATDMNMKFVQNTTDINMKLVQNSTDINTSALKFLTKTITDVPVLKQKNKEIVKSLEDSRTNNLPLPQYMIMKYKKEQFEKWLGDIIAKAYKGNTHELQEIFTTDISRLKYIIGQISGKNKKAQWVEDVGGLQVMELVIKPVLEMISKLITEAIRQNAIDEIGNIDKMDKSEIDKLIEFQRLGTELINEITKKKLPAAILKNIASHVAFKRCNFDSDTNLLEDKKEELSDESEDEKTKTNKIKIEMYESSDEDTKSKKKKIIKKKDSDFESSSDSSSDEDTKSKKKKIIKKKDSESESSDEDTKSKKKKIIKKKYSDSESSDSSSDEDTKSKKKKIIKKKYSDSDSSSDEDTKSKKKKIIKKKDSDSESSSDSSSDEDTKSKKKKIIKKKDSESSDEDTKSKKKKIIKKKDSESESSDEDTKSKNKKIIKKK
jgi:hypothetical protein